MEFKKSAYQIAAEKDVDYILKNYTHIDDVQSYLSKNIAATHFDHEYIDCIADELKYRTEDDRTEGVEYILMTLLIQDEMFWMDLYNREAALEGLEKGA